MSWHLWGSVCCCKGCFLCDFGALFLHFNQCFYGCTQQYCIPELSMHMHTHTHTRARLMALFPGQPGWAGTRMVKPVWILLKQGTMSGSGISWAICKFAPHCRQMTTPAPHYSVFYRPDALPAAQPTASKHWRPLSTYFWKIQSLEICVVLCKPCMCIAVGLRLAASHWLIAIFVMLISIVIQQL